MKILASALTLALATATLTAHADCGASHQKAEVPRDLVDTAVAAGSFHTLVTALKAAGLVETLRGDGPFTVFAPTDDAFAKLPAGTVEALLRDKAKLAAILTYHVVPGRVDSKQVVKLDSAKTVQGQSLSIDTTTDGVMVDDARIVQVDIATSNGVIHVIDSVLIPQS